MAAHDLSEPIRELLYGLRLLEHPRDEGDVRATAPTPVSLQVITAGATALAKWWTTAVASLGGLAAVTAGLRGLGGFGSDDPLRQAVATASAAVLGSAVVIGIAVIIRADVCGRATASAAEYRARAAVANALLTSFQYGKPLPPLPAPAAPPPQYWVQTQDGEWFAVQRFKWDSNRLVATVDDGRDVPASNFKWLMPSPPDPARL